VEKLIITAALTGGVTVPTQTPYLPYTPEQIIDQAVEAAEAGAASVHIHARRPSDGMPVADLELFGQYLRGIKGRSRVIVCTTTGGGLNMTPQERLRVVPMYKPELASCNMGSMNFSVHPIATRYKDWNFPWEKPYLEGSKDFIFRNTFGDIAVFVQTMKENGTRPEFEIYDTGHLYNLQYLIRSGLVELPVWLQFVTGVLGGIGSDIESVMHLKQTADRLLGQDNYLWSVIGCGYPAEFHVATLAIMMGGHVRVGLEDNIFVRRGVLAKSNAELVRKIVRLAEELERPVATPDEARKILGLKGIENVNY
jgi:uncharacterized protein (DUF849 family)